MPRFSRSLQLGQITKDEELRLKLLIKGLYRDEDYLPISLLVCKTNEEKSVIALLKIERG